MKTDPPASSPAVSTKEELHTVVVSSLSKQLPSPSKVVFPPLPPSTPVGNWILTGHSFAPQRAYFMRYCAGLARRRVVDHLLWFEFPNSGVAKPKKVPVHYSRLTWAGGPLAQLIVPPPESKHIDHDSSQNSYAHVNNTKEGTSDSAFASSKDQSDGDTEKNKPDVDITTIQPDIEANKAQLDVGDGNAQSTQSNLGADNTQPDVGADDGQPNVDPDKTPDVTPDVQMSSPKSESPIIAMDLDNENMDVYVRDTPFVLSEDVSHRTFAIIIKFLYCEEICFNYLTFDEIVALATAAHRWMLTDLYNATFAYVMDQDLLAGGSGIRTFIPLVSHPETPESFRRYFCIAIGHHFDVLYPRLNAQAKTENSLGINKSSRPQLWDVIIRQKMMSHVVHCIRLYSEQSYDFYLLDIILRYFEPTVAADDDEVVGLLTQLNWDQIDPNVVFQRDGICKGWSTRALRLAALSSFAPHTESLEARIPWNIPLQRLLKTEVWSFQTEHVFCGPYICYLHVRKNNSPEVSLFVHIWNRDGKPIMDNARHERVRVMCRATEMNCSCDSGKQWSDSSHGFLENLKFEGRLQRYPGLGWSQFLEARRLDEWRACHGEDCGLAITTVLQFLKPKKQFEGLARRASTRSSSPTRMSSPIQKRRPGLKMKLRESR